MKHDKLKPCPLCGGEVTIALTGTVRAQFFTITRGHGSNACKCRLFLESDVFEPNNEEYRQKMLDTLVKRWNTRAGVEN